MDFLKVTQIFIIKKPFKDNVISLHPFGWSLLAEKKIKLKIDVAFPFND